MYVIDNSSLISYDCFISNWEMADYFTQLKRKGLIHDIVWVEKVGADYWRGKEDKSIDNGGGGNIALEGNGGRLIAKQGHKGLGSMLAIQTGRCSNLSM